MILTDQRMNLKTNNLIVKIVENLFVKFMFLIQKKSHLQYVDKNKRNDASDSDDNDMGTDDNSDCYDNCCGRLILNK